MKLTFKARNMEISEALHDYVDKRLSKFDKLIGAEEALVSMSVIRGRNRIEVTIPFNGVVIRGEEEGYDMYACIDNVTDKLENQLHKYRTRLIRRSRVAAAREAAATATVPETTNYFEDEPPVRIKSFTTKPMPIDEAVMQMNLLGHNFFVFINDHDQSVNVVYRRKDGDYGLLVPEK